MAELNPLPLSTLARAGGPETDFYAPGACADQYCGFAGDPDDLIECDNCGAKRYCRKHTDRDRSGMDLCPHCCDNEGLRMGHSTMRVQAVIDGGAWVNFESTTGEMERCLRVAQQQRLRLEFWEIGERAAILLTRYIPTRRTRS